MFPATNRGQNSRASAVSSHEQNQTVQVRDFDGIVAWYRDVLDLGIGWLEAGEFCTLTMPGSGTVLALATDHPDRISDDPGTG